MIKYSFLDQLMTVNTQPITGFAEGDDVVLGSRVVDAFSNIVGSDGKMLVTQTANRSGIIIFKLLRGCGSNAYLNGLFLDQERGNVFIPVSVVVYNKISGTSQSGTKGYIHKPADVTMGNGAAALEWSITVENYDAFFGTLPAL